MEIRVTNSIGELGAEEWVAASAGTSFYSFRPWHCSLEADPSHDICHVTACRPYGSLLGVLPVHLDAGGPDGGVGHFYGPRRLFGDAGDEQRAPSLLIGGRAGYETHALLKAGLGAAGGARRSRALWGEPASLPAPGRPTAPQRCT